MGIWGLFVTAAKSPSLTERVTLQITSEPLHLANTLGVGWGVSEGLHEMTGQGDWLTVTGQYVCCCYHVAPD